MPAFMVQNFRFCSGCPKVGSPCEPSGSRNPLGVFLALDVILKARTIFSPLFAWATEFRKCKAHVGNISSLQAHTAKLHAIKTMY